MVTFNIHLETRAALVAPVDSRLMELHGWEPSRMDAAVGGLNQPTGSSAEKHTVQFAHTFWCVTFFTSLFCVVFAYAVGMGVIFTCNERCLFISCNTFICQQSDNNICGRAAWRRGSSSSVVKYAL